MVERERAIRSIAILAGIGMALAILLETAWLLMAHIAFGVWDVWIVKIRSCIWVAFVVALCCYRRFPWAAVIVSWIDWALIFRGTIPWNVVSNNSFSRQFMSDIIFAVAAHIGLVAHLLLKKSKGLSNQPVSSARRE
jgi:hypothetical protein